MDRAGSLPAALFRHAARTPEEPWLFYRRGWDWSWLPWRTLAHRVAAWMEAVAPLEAGRRAAFSAVPGPPAIALDLALQGAGLLSVPLAPELAGEALAAALAERRAEVWVETTGREGAVGLPCLRLPAWPEEGPSGLDRTGPPAPPPLLHPGGAVVAGGRLLTAADLVAASAAIEALLPVSPARPKREILVSCRPLSDPAERPLLAWATGSGAALVLEPDRAAGAATAAWARPTLFHGTAREVAALRQAVGRRRDWRPWRRRRPRLPFGRLHTLLVDGALPAGERAFWEERGVRVASVPALPSGPPP